MAEEKKKERKEKEMGMDFSWSAEAEGGTYVKSSDGSKQIRKICPLGMRVLVQIRKEADQTEAGLYLPEGSKESKQDSLLGEILEVASALDEDTDEETNISGVPQGSLILIPRDVGTRVPWDDDLRIVETADILAIVHEVNVT